MVTDSVFDFAFLAALEPSDGDLHGGLPALPPEHSGRHPVSPADLDCGHSGHPGVDGHRGVVLFLREYPGAQTCLIGSRAKRLQAGGRRHPRGPEHDAPGKER